MPPAVDNVVILLLLLLLDGIAVVTAVAYEAGGVGYEGAVMVDIGVMLNESL